MTASTFQDFTSITEMPGGLVTAEQRARLCQRYVLAREHAAGRRVLEVACGSGLGLPIVAGAARWLVGGDYTGVVLDAAQAHTGGAIPLARFDAQQLPFGDASFDLILCFEAIYYLARPEWFLAGCRQTLAAGGLLVIGSENKAWPHFAPGPLSTAYYTAPELAAMLADAGFDSVQFFGSFEVAAYTPTQRARASLRRAITATGVFKRYPQARELLKPMAYRDAQPLADDICRGQTPPPLVPLDAREAHGEFKVIYALARPSRNDER
jgi:SAM-dependent methyltransferase